MEITDDLLAVSNGDNQFAIDLHARLLHEDTRESLPFFCDLCGGFAGFCLFSHLLESSSRTSSFAPCWYTPGLALVYRRTSPGENPTPMFPSHDHQGAQLNSLSVASPT